MALVNIGNDPWLTEYDACDKLQREIMEQLTLRSKELKNSENYIRLSASVRLRLKQFNVEVEQLKVKLDQESKTKSITYEEIERRSRQLEQLRSKNVMMTKMFENNKSLKNNTRIADRADRSQLIGVHDLGTSDWGIGNDDDEMLQANIAENSVDNIRHQQQQMVQDQDKGLEELSKIISRQKNIAQTISSEVDLQNEIIDDLGEHMTRTDLRVVNETSQVQIVATKDRTCGYWVVIILLFISIIVAAVV